MATFISGQGSLLDSPAEGLVNTVNTVGVMGKGIALQFRENYPHNYEVYRKACKEGMFSIGHVLAVWDQTALGQKCILNFPTKKHWRSPSEYAYIEAGLPALCEHIQVLRLDSVAIPPLGCGNGGLDWARVKPMIEAALRGLPIEVHLYEPNANIRKHLREKSPTKKMNLTPRQALLLQGLYDYERGGENISLLVANKIVYFLQRLGQDMGLSFQPYIYGPYAPEVRHVVYHFNGSFLTGMEQKDARPFDTLYLNYQAQKHLEQYMQEHLTREQLGVLERLRRLMDGFQSALGVELLSTVDYIVKDLPDANVEDVVQRAGSWSDRKKKLLDKRHVAIVLERIREFRGEGLLCA